MSSEDRENHDACESFVAKMLESEKRGDSVDRDARLADRSNFVNSLRGFFTNDDRTKATADLVERTLLPGGSGFDDPMIFSGPGWQAGVIIPPQHSDVDRTLPSIHRVSQPDVPSLVIRSATSATMSC